VLLAPTAWVHYLVLMLLPFIMMAIAAKCGRASHRAIWMAVASFRIAFGEHPHGILRSLAGEGSFMTLATAYVSAYWFATDELPVVNVAAQSASAHSEV
jgi:hypothetical protein